MTQLFLEREALLPRLDGIRKNIKRLKELGKLSFKDFSQGDPYDLAHHHLRLALEGVFHISTHILSRFPGARAVEYKEIAKRMGENQIVPRNFAEQKLVPMAGLRNILVHHYSDIDPQKFHQIIKNHLVDIETFLSHIKGFLEKLKDFNLEMK